jgi:hypothetical protein
MAPHKDSDDEENIPKGSTAKFLRSPLRTRRWMSPRFPNYNDNVLSRTAVSGEFVWCPNAQYLNIYKGSH